MSEKKEDKTSLNSNQKEVFQKQVESLPSAPGVYLFLQNKKPIYIGKATNIKARIKSHLQNSLYDKKEQLIINKADKVNYILTNNDFDSLLLEAKLIKEYQPVYNIRQKDNKSFLYIAIDKNEVFPKIKTVRKTEIEKNQLVFGPFSSQKIVQNVIRLLRRIIPFCTQKKISSRPCFYSKIGLCNPCPNQIVNTRDEKIKKILAKKYQDNIKKIIKILKGDSLLILKNYQKKLKLLIKEKKYEEAIVIRNKITSFYHLLNGQFYQEEKDYQKITRQALENLKKIIINYFPQIKDLKRIEAYDVSNLGSKIIVGAMSCFINGVPDKSEYRKFKIKKNRFNDSQRIIEILERRFKNNWQHPQLIIIDGGKPQLRLVDEFMKKNRLNIPVLGIAKNPDRIILGKDFKTIFFSHNNPGFNLIRQARDEVHRFAKKYYLTLTKKYYNY